MRVRCFESTDEQNQQHTAERQPRQNAPAFEFVSIDHARIGPQMLMQRNHLRHHYSIKPWVADSSR